MFVGLNVYFFLIFEILFWRCVMRIGRENSKIVGFNAQVLGDSARFKAWALGDNAGFNTLALGDSVRFTAWALDDGARFKVWALGDSAMFKAWALGDGAMSFWIQTQVGIPINHSMLWNQILFIYPIIHLMSRINFTILTIHINEWIFEPNPWSLTREPMNFNNSYDPKWPQVERTLTIVLLFGDTLAFCMQLKQANASSNRPPWTYPIVIAFHETTSLAEFHQKGVLRPLGFV